MLADVCQITSRARQIVVACVTAQTIMIDLFRQLASETKIYRNTANHRLGTIIALHGGCFVNGDASWDAEQNHWMSSLGYDVHQMQFPTTSIVDFDKWMSGSPMTEFLQQERKLGPVILLGRSSGGYLAKRFFEKHKAMIDKVFYLCPVLRPMLRAVMLPSFAKDTSIFFGEHILRNQLPSLSVKWDSVADCWQDDKEVLMLAECDNNIPYELFTDEQLQAAILLPGCDSHKSALTSTGDRLGDLLSLP